MSIRKLSIALLGGLLLTLCTSAFGTEKGSRIHATLVERNLLEAYMLDLIADVAADLTRVSQKWSRAQVNGRYDPNVVNIYLVNGDRVPKSNVLAPYGIELAQYVIKGNAVAEEEVGIVFVDTKLLRELAAVSVMQAERNERMRVAVAKLEARGLQAFKDLWDPSANPLLRSREAGQKWSIAYRGALAFVLAHEMGHLAHGSKDLPGEKPIVFSTQRERDLHWACPRRVGPATTMRRQIETQADQYAVGLIKRVTPPDGDRFLYEYGTHWYLLYLSEKSYIEAIPAIKDNISEQFSRMRYGADLYAELADGRVRGGPVKVFYPKTHPNAIVRQMGALAQLFQSPQSMFYGEGADPVFAAFAERLEAECEAIRVK